VAGIMSSWYTALNSWRLAAARKARHGAYTQLVRVLTMLFTAEHRLVNSVHLESFPLDRTKPRVGATADSLTEIDEELRAHSLGPRAGGSGRVAATRVLTSG
jgi:hypothetical protein